MTGPYRVLLALVSAAILAAMWPAGASALAPGDLDPSFGTGGVSVPRLGAGSAPGAQIKAVALQPDGKIVLAGSGSDGSGHDAFLVARLDPNGQLDPTFGNGGELLVQLDSGPSPSSEATAVALQPDGKILVGGQSQTTAFVLARLTPNGSFDPSFAQDGKLFDPQPSEGFYTPLPATTAVAVQPDGQILIGGTLLDYHATDMLVARINGGNGTFDASFGDHGVVLKQLENSGARFLTQANALALEPDGKIVTTGYVGNDSLSSLLVTRLGAGGGVDGSFGNQGAVQHNVFDPNCGGSTDTGNALAIQPDGKLVIAGHAGGTTNCASPQSNPVLVARLNGDDGSFDQSFGNGGIVAPDLGSGASPFASLNAVALQPDGGIVVAGSATGNDGRDELLVARLGSDGSFDPTFANAGTYRHQFDGTGMSDATALALQPDGDVIVAGLTSSSTPGSTRALVVRLIGLPDISVSPLAPGSPSRASAGARARVSALRLSPVSFAAANAGASIASDTGTSVSYRDNQPASTRFTVLKPRRGVRHAGRCLKPGRGRSGRACTRYVAVGSFRHHDTRGNNSFHFTGRVARHKLAAGLYRLRALPSFGGRKGHAAHRRFRIVP